MRVVVHASDYSVEFPLMQALLAAQGRGHRIAATALPKLAEFRTALYRDRDLIGVLWTRVENYAAMTLREFRSDGILSPILVLLDNDDLGMFDARVAAFTAMLIRGADDVQRFPIDGREFVARLEALHRRERQDADVVSLPNGAFYRPGIGRVYYDGGEVWLTGKECELLQILSSRPNVVLTKEMLLDALYQGRDEAKLKIIDVFIHKVRKKMLVALGGLDVIETVWGRGYRFKAEGFRPAISEHNARLVG